MIKPTMKICTFLLAAGLMIATAGVKAQSVIPIPLRMEQGSGTFLFTGDTKLYTNLKGEEKKMLMDYLETLPIHFKNGKKQTKDNVVSLMITKANPQLSSPESYTLEVTPHKITVQATSGAGLFYGVQTLLQMAQPAMEGAWSVQATTIQDSPRFEYRGLMLDVSRHFRSKEFVKKQIDALAYYKLNRLHLHLTDAAGWRIEIKKYPLLTELAAWRPEVNWKRWWNEGGRKYCRFDAPGASGGYYTQDDIRELVNYARERHITIIPEIEMPAHSEEVLTAYPELSCSGEPYKNADFCVGNEKTFTFLEDVLTEVMELFPSQYIHVGGDEAGKAAWKTCPKCQKRMKDEQLDNVDELQSYLIHRVEVFLNAHGRKLLGWDEILQGGLAPNATVMSWRGEQGGIDAVKSGHQAIMTPGSHCYIDSYQDAPYSQPEAIGGYLPLEKVYSYNPIPASLTPDEAKLIYGVQANLWAEYIQTDEHCEYMIYPRILALAEVAWSAPERKSWTDFRPRALKAVAYLQSKGYHPFDLKKEIGNRPEAAQPVQHLALGKTVKYNAPYNSSYPAQGDKTLTDGIRGSWTYSDGAWQGFISRDRLDITIDMGKSTDLHSIGADFMQVVGPEVFLPVEVIISVSEDGENFTELSRQTHEVVKSDAVVFKNYAWNGNAKGRYVRYQARAGEEFGGWVFTDEIVVK
ncbi:glycoside hydrolase family 20 protein [Bacteroides hominis]|uniref:glycoside hydrolase family 20 protein n=1 Tax=Bacteroides TaxID=816 RepID=UPI001D0ECF26|nr:MULTISPECIES: family 20 glycosylhydrolase [Bacteroides]MCC2233110.1 family 20 glycosylhydrolase [Bacteroides hominis (ex Afrizal et al. 2022)]MCE8557477.1 family 20 glycosylhydrolase [Bacteroides fragilis]MCF2688395.1 family 20 glycosylhydrolase [Bacteroides fragilis]MCX8463721.1 family 20 glycosylhydrolase [Bacteroides fragilis]MDV6132744.1 family 20 glycosylhydrolase [Bacteroides hominis (ex Liu et al. 2022)]